MGVVIICLLVAIILNISTKTTATVLTKQKDYTLSSTTVVKGLFAVSSLRYADVENASCTLADNYQRPVSLVLRMHAYEVPESCSLFVDQVLIRTERKLSPDCKESCDFTEFDRGISVGLADYRDDHVLRVCCNQICIEEILPSLCGQPEKKVAVATPLPDKKNLYLSLGIGIGLIVFVSAIVIVSHHQRKL